MANMTDALENKFLDGVTGNDTWLSSTMYLALFTADPGDAGSVTNELSGNGYTRIALTGLFPAAAGGTVQNDTVVTSVTASGAWAEVTHVGYMLSGTPGTDDMQSWAILVTPVTVLNGGTFEAAVDGLVLTAD